MSYMFFVGEPILDTVKTVSAIKEPCKIGQNIMMHYKILTLDYTIIIYEILISKIRGSSSTGSLFIAH